MPYGKRKSGKMTQVFNKSSGKVYGTHSSEEKANKQLAALHMHTDEAAKKKAVKKSYTNQLPPQPKMSEVFKVSEAVVTQQPSTVGKERSEFNTATKMLSAADGGSVRQVTVSKPSTGMPAFSTLGKPDPAKPNAMKIVKPGTSDITSIDKISGKELTDTPPGTTGATTPAKKF